VGPDDLKRRIEQGIPGATARVEGADAHFGAVVVARAFEGKSRIEQHQMIYALFRDEMASQAIHALALKTCTPAEWEKEKATGPGPVPHV
jgi:acid stress-induced BolA-like protein IbaG/YrbA